MGVLIERADGLMYYKDEATGFVVRDDYLVVLSEAQVVLTYKPEVWLAAEVQDADA